MKVLMHPFEFDPEKRNPQLNAYFEHVFQAKQLNPELSDEKQKLIKHTLEQLKEGTAYEGVRCGDLGISKEEFHRDWKEEYFPIRTLLLFWWQILDAVNQPGAFESEETVTMYTGTFFELLSKTRPRKYVSWNQKTVIGIKDDRPDKSFMVGPHTLLEFEGTPPTNSKFPQDAMKGACSGAHSVRMMWDALGVREEGAVAETLLVLAKGPTIHTYTTQEPYGKSDIAVTMPI
ncbi:hypothetical protein HDU93_002712 [Gonapodya sp. JEL0774]|nr:hypothetical protein HDU93_002712 [Gonapodya sp. JEL0774]